MSIARCLVALLWICLLGQAQAHWTEQPDLPEWAQRGKLYWCLHYSTHTRPLVDLFLDGGQTLVQGGAFDSPQTAEYARQRGLRYMSYVCSRTMTIQDMANHPQLKGAVLLKPDGSELLAYNNPVRRYGCLFAPAWPEFVRQCTGQVMDTPDTAAIFYDNVYVNEDHHPMAVASWKKWATDHSIEAGDGMPALREGGPRGAAGRAFNAEALIAYYAGLRAFNREHQPPLLISPNLGSLSGYGPAIMEAGAVDLVFYETMSHPPFENNAYRYKLGLAASHGRPTGVLAYLPEKIAAQRGIRTWHEGMHHFFYLSSPIAEEFSLAAAEAAACGGTYIPCYNLFPSLPITDLNDPFHQRIHRAIKQSYAFLHAHESLYAGTRPGANVGIFHSTATQIQGRLAQNNEGLAKALIAAGIPFEVVVAADLTGDGTRGLDTLVVQNALYLDESTAAGILRFAERGGRVILTGGYASFDPIGRPATYASAQQLLEAVRLVNVPLAQWKLEGFERENGRQFRVKQKTGLATLRFAGLAGRYIAHIRMLDENNGTSPFSLAVGDKVVFEGKLDFEDERMHWFSSLPFDLVPGDALTLTVHAHAGERGRTQAIVLTAADTGSGTPVGRGEVVFSPGPIEDLPAENLVRLLRPKVHVLNPGKTLVNVLDCPGKAVQTVHLVNYDFRYKVTVPGLYATDDPKNLAHNPGFELMSTPHAETELTIAPAERVEVLMKGKSCACLALSPESPPAWLEGEAKGDATVYTVPRVDIYTMLVLADSRAALEPLLQAQIAAAPWTIPPVTVPLRRVLADWQPYGKGFVTDTTNPRGGKQAVRCENDSSSQKAGLMQQFDLQQEEPRPIVISAWSRAENVAGKPDSGYAIYADATCDDGSIMKTLNSPFPTGTRDWNQATLKISPTKPIRVLNLYLLFRGHTGRVWFDEVSVKAEE